MDKRLPIFLAVSLLIVIGWGLLFPQRQPPKTTTAPAPAISTPQEGATVGVPGATIAAAPPGATPPGATPPGGAPSGPDLGPRIEGTDEPDLVIAVGRRGEEGSLRYVFTNRGGALAELRSGSHFDHARLSEAERDRPEHWTQLLSPVDTGAGRTSSFLLRASPSSRSLAREMLDSAAWRRAVLGPADLPDGVEFTLAPGTGVTFVKRFLFHPGGQGFRFELEIRNDALEDASGPREIVLVGAACMPAESGDAWYSEPQAVACSRSRGGVSAPLVAQMKDDRGRETAGAFGVEAPLSFAGGHNKYFAVLMHGADETSAAAMIGASWRRLRDEGWARAHPAERDRAWRQIVTDVQISLTLPPRGESRTLAFEVYAGPKDRRRLEAAWPDHEKLVRQDLGFFNGIASVLLAVLSFFESITGNWGIAIILLTISVRVILFPVNRRSQTAMARYQSKMKRLQPKIDEIKKRFANDPGQQRQEQAKLMQSEGAFPPLGGCLPMFLQIPVFIGLFAALRCSFDLRQAPFYGWIRDLALPDRLLPLGLQLPLIGTIEYLNILPPLMVVLWIWQQKGMPVPADEQAARMQKMMMWMPVMMGFFLYNYAAGLSLYMITQSGLGIVEQKVIRKYWPVDDRELPKKKTGFLARLAQAQEQQKKRLQGRRR